MVWIATALTIGAGIYGASEKKKAQNEANAANEARYGQSLGLIGWGQKYQTPGQSQADILFDLIAGSVGFPKDKREHKTFLDKVSSHLDFGAGSAIADAFKGKNVSKDKWQSLIADYLDGDSATSHAAQKQLEALGLDEGKLGKLATQAKQQYDSSTKQLTIWGMMENALDKAEGTLLAQGKLIEQGYSKAKQAIHAAAANAGQSAYGEIVSQEKKAMAETEAGLARRGLYSTTVGYGYKQQIRSGAGKAFSSIAERVGLVQGQLLSGLEVARTNALTQYQGSLANFYQNRAGAEMGLGQSYLNVILGRNDTQGPSFLDMIGGGQGLAGIYAGTKGAMDAWKGAA